MKHLLFVIYYKMKKVQLLFEDRYWTNNSERKGTDYDGVQEVK